MDRWPSAPTAKRCFKEAPWSVIIGAFGIMKLKFGTIISGSPLVIDAMTKTKIERPDVLEIAAMRARWKEERAAGATGETFARWRKRIRAEVIDELREVLNGDPRRWPDPRKRDLGKPERRKRPRAV